MARLNLTLDADTFQKLDRHSGRVGRPRARVSNDIANRFGQAVTVVPTQAHTRERAARAYVVDIRRPRSNLTDARVANASMVMTYDRSRVVKRAGRVSSDAQRALDRALAVHLALVSV